MFIQIPKRPNRISKTGKDPSTRKSQSGAPIRNPHKPAPSNSKLFQSNNDKPSSKPFSSQKRKLSRVTDNSDDDDEDDILNDKSIGTDTDDDIDKDRDKDKDKDKDNENIKPKTSGRRYSSDSQDSDDSDDGGATRKLSAREPISRKRRRSRSRSRERSSDSDNIDSRMNNKRFKRKQTKRASTKIFTSFGAGNKFRKENDLEPKKKRRRRGGRGRQNLDEYGYAHDIDDVQETKKKKKAKKIRNCAVCQKELNEDNLGKYCGEICKKEGFVYIIYDI